MVVVKGTAAMQTFSLFIQDRRYSVPTLRFLVVKDAARAREIALQELLASPDHLSVEICDESGGDFREERSAH